MRRAVWGNMIALLLLSCNPNELPPPSQGDIVFSVAGEVEGAPLNLSAGLEGYFMYTEGAIDSSGLWQATGRLGALGCLSGCPPELSFRFQSAGEAQLDSLLLPGLVPVLSPGETVIDTIFQAVLSASSGHFSGIAAAAHSWELADSVFAIGQTAVIPDLQMPVEVTLTTTMADNCTSTTTKQVSPLSGNALPCTVGFQIDSGGLDSVIIATVLPGQDWVQTFRWQGVVEGEVFTTFLPFQAPLDICLEGINLDGCIAQQCQTIIPGQPGGAASGCFNDFSIEVQPSEVATHFPGALNGVALMYTDVDGNVFSSEWGAQPPGTFFEVISASPYEVNAFGQATRRVAINLRLQLFSASGVAGPEAQLAGEVAIGLP